MTLSKIVSTPWGWTKDIIVNKPNSAKVQIFPRWQDRAKIHSGYKGCSRPNQILSWSQIFLRMRNADDDLVDRSSEKITPGSGISRCQEVKNPPLGGIIIILSSSHLIILIIILISNPCILHYFIIDSSSQPCAKHKMAVNDKHSPTVRPDKVFQKKKRTLTLK